MTLALVFVECAKDLASSAEQAVRRVQGVSEAHTIKNTAHYDLLIKVQTDDDIQFKDTITNLKKVVGIAAIAVSIVYGSVH